MDEVVIRRAEPNDAEGIALSFRSRGTAAGTLQNPHPSIAEWQERLARDAAKNYILVALAANEVIGHCGLHGNANARRQHAWGVGIGVRDDWQRRGVGTRLMAALLDLADNWLGALRLELTVYTDNEAAIRLYRKLGFVIEGTERCFALREGVYVDALMMARLHPRPPQLPGAA